MGRSNLPVQYWFLYPLNLQFAVICQLANYFHPPALVAVIENILLDVQVFKLQLDVEAAILILEKIGI